MFTKKDKDNNNKESRGPDDEDEDQLEQKQEETIEQETTLDHTTSASNICSVLLSSGIFTTIYIIKSTFKICYSLVAIPFKIPSRITFQIRIWICFLMPLGYSDDGSVKDIFFRL